MNVKVPLPPAAVVPNCSTAPDATKILLAFESPPPFRLKVPFCTWMKPVLATAASMSVSPLPAYTANTAPLALVSVSLPVPVAPMRPSAVT
mgnify:CR=1 FL=1